MKKIVLILLLIIPMVSYSHVDLTRIYKYGNVNITITTGFNYEIINKTQIAGQLAELLLKELKYDKPVEINIRHRYTSDTIFSPYFRIHTKKDSIIVIDAFYKEINPQQILKLVEYISTVGSNRIKKMQKEFTEELLGLNKTVTRASIDGKIIEKVLSRAPSKTVTNILANNKIYKPTKEGERALEITYYYQNNKYHFVNMTHTYSKGKVINSTEEVLLVVDDFYQATPVGDRSMIVFDTRKSFRFLSTRVGGTYILPQEKVSKVYTYDDLAKEGSYTPIEVVLFGGNKLALTVRYSGYTRLPNGAGRYGPTLKSMIYYIQDGVFIENADEILRNQISQ